MASGIANAFLTLAPAHLFLFQLIASSSAIGLTAPGSIIRTLTLPIVAASVYGIAKTSMPAIGPRQAGVFTGYSFLFLLRYIDVGLITCWNFASRGPSKNLPPNDVRQQQVNSKGPANRMAKTSQASIWTRFAWGWSVVWSFRQINTPYEVRNTPPFSATDPNYVPSRWLFVLERAIVAVCCYLVLDLLDQRPPPSNAEVFHPSLIPIFRRLSEVTWPQIKLRLLSFAGFGVTFYCIPQAVYSLAAAVCVASGLSKVSSWRPAFGSISDAYTLRRFWGKVWHQFMRRILTGPAAYIAYDICGLERGSLLASSTMMFLSFVISGSMHMTAQLASGGPMVETGVFAFFCTQACGVVFEMSVFPLLQRRFGNEGTARPHVLKRVIGFAWVVAFLAWSGPSWLYPQAVRQMQRTGTSTFAPYSLIKAWKRQYVTGIARLAQT